jgi:non-ribosomal peptide synthetase component F
LAALHATPANKAIATLFHVLLTAFTSLLFRYTAASDFLIGVPLSGRTRPETAGLVGYLTNLVPLRFRPSHRLAASRSLPQTRTRLLPWPRTRGGIVPDVLFVCVHNAGRSRMAEALFNREAAGRSSPRVHLRTGYFTTRGQMIRILSLE